VRIFAIVVLSRQFKLYIGYWTSNNNKLPKCPCRYRTPSPDNIYANDVIDNDVTDNDVIDSWLSWMNVMHTLLASRPNVVASTRVRSHRARRARCERGFSLGLAYAGIMHTAPKVIGYTADARVERKTRSSATPVLDGIRCNFSGVG